MNLTFVRVALLALAAAAFAIFHQALAAAFAPHDALRNLAYLLLLVALTALPIPRKGGRVRLDLPLYTLVFTLHGWVLAAALGALALLLAPSTTRRYAIGARFLRAAECVPLFCAAGLTLSGLQTEARFSDASGLVAFFAINAAWIVPATLLRANLRVGRLADWWLWIAIVVQIAWGYVATQVALHGGIALAVATLVPLLLLALALRALARSALAVHRLRLAREAVQALLGESDPLPHINAILSSVHSELLKETLQILAPGANVTGWTTVASRGPVPEDAAVQVRRQALRRLTDSERSYASASSRAHHIVAFAAR
ncbi:MAG: hypothetical protein JOZ38_03325, partial [Candidatus Eremiobacteraeota bacterium]|nr:hypothetical protein [Candidatus Eremiobacteraeota bacterium]